MKTPEEIKKGLEYCMAGSPIVCNNCPYEGQFCEDDELLADALAYICQLEVAQPKWISVDEQLPEPFVSVLAYMPDADPFPTVREAFWVGDRFFFPALADRAHVTYWMPMPKPLKEE